MLTEEAMKSQSLVCLSLALSLSASWACGSKQKFGGEGTSAPPQKTAEPEIENAEPAVKPPAPVLPAPPACDKGSVGLTSATLLSSGIKTLRPDQRITYELSVISCKDGTSVPLTNQTIWFDINARAVGGFQPISYRVSDAKTKEKIGEGILEIVEFSDLFGNTGEYAHWETQSLSYNTSLDSLLLEIDFKETAFTTADLGGEVIASYLKVGEAQAVQQDLKVLK
jgi:hypothetical protein